MSDSAEMLDFDESMARGIEAIYRTPDVAGQRSEVVAQLALRVGERVLDIGSGPGMLLTELAACVTETGEAVGVDASAPMNAIASARVAHQPWAAIREADATALPLPDDHFDAAVSTQVYEYVPDMHAALSEVARVLRPGGRLLILDTDWDSLVCATDDRDRMQRVMKAWDAHLHDPNLPAHLPKLLRDAGFVLERCSVFPLLNTERHPNCYSTGIQGAIHGFVRGRPEIGEAVADAWLAEQQALSERGDYFFSLNRYLFVAHLPRA